MFQRRSTMLQAPAARTVSWLLSITGVLLGAWAAVTWAHIGAFDHDVESVFSPAAFPDADTTVAVLEGAFLIGPILATLLAVLNFSQAIRNARRRARRWGLLATTVIVLVFTAVTLLRNGADYIKAEGTGTPDVVTNAAVRRLAELTPWRYGGFYHGFTIGIAVLSMVLMVVAIALLMLPGFRDSFSASRKQV